MKISICTITFRHHLISLRELASWARTNGFDGIELWGPHARSLSVQHPRCGSDWMATLGMRVCMISDYLPTEGEEAWIRSRAQELCELAARWGAPKLRTFAGTTPSADAGEDARRAMSARIRLLSRIVADHGLRLLVETHPNTLADTCASTLRLLDEVGDPALGVNFDALHVWEGGDDPVEARRRLGQRIGHYHFKNVRSRDDLGVFAPANVYAAAGGRDGMVPLFNGAMDYGPLLEELSADPDAEASLEWFGPDCFRTLAADRRELASRMSPAMFQPSLAV